MSDRHDKRPQSRPVPPVPQRAEVYDGIELTDEDLEVVVGGLDPEASMAHARYLQDLLARDGR